MEYLIQKFLKQNNLTGTNGAHYTLRDDGQGVYIDKWTYNIPKPTFTQEDFDEAALEEVKAPKILKCKSYLLSTDWYIAREIDEPNSYSQIVKDNRILARKLINQIQLCTTLKELNAINIEF